MNEIGTPLHLRALLFKVLDGRYSLSFALGFSAMSGPLSVGVTFDVKVHEHDEKEHSLRQCNDHLRQRVTAVDEQRYSHVKKQYYKLSQLELGEVAFPPKVLLHRGSHQRKEVVGVHDHVHEAVEDDAEGDVAICAVRETEPAVEDH